MNWLAYYGHLPEILAELGGSSQDVDLDAMMWTVLGSTARYLGSCAINRALLWTKWSTTAEALQMSTDSSGLGAAPNRRCGGRQRKARAWSPSREGTGSSATGARLR